MIELALRSLRLISCRMISVVSVWMIFLISVIESKDKVGHERLLDHGFFGKELLLLSWRSLAKAI
jgi:hypothetical protein